MATAVRLEAAGLVAPRRSRSSGPLLASMLSLRPALTRHPEAARLLAHPAQQLIAVQSGGTGQPAGFGFQESFCQQAKPAG